MNNLSLPTNREVIGVAALSDTLRDEATDIVAALSNRNIKVQAEADISLVLSNDVCQVYIATGDHVSTATRVAAALGIPSRCEILGSESRNLVDEGV